MEFQYTVSTNPGVCACACEHRALIYCGALHNQMIDYSLHYLIIHNFYGQYHTYNHLTTYSIRTEIDIALRLYDV